MVSYRTSRMIPTILTVIVIIGAIIGLVAIARAVFFSGNSSQGNSTQDSAAQAVTALLDTSDGSSVSMTVRGPIVADENFRSYQITISPSRRQVVTYKGYLDTVIQQQDLSNNVTAYDEFVHALSKANMTVGKQLSDAQNDVRGICAVGRVYEFKVLKAGDSVQTLWTSTCGGSQGSLKASVTQLTQLFSNQIPNAQSIIRPLAI